mmetsp:Transcript_11455/g.26955  ORF Transcript_11455/g.26955 Transcript_11455/m.26955 type:complete len:449 (-) Transcript_11455:414-1760(-)
MRSRADPAFCADSLRALLRLALLWLRCPQDVLLQLPRQLRARTPHLGQQRLGCGALGDIPAAALADDRMPPPAPSPPRPAWHSRGPLSSPALALPELSGRIATTVAVHRRAGDGRGHVLVDDHAQRILVQLHRVDVRALLAAVPEPGVDKVVDWHVLAVVEHAAENRAVRRAREQRRRRWQHPARELHLSEELVRAQVLLEVLGLGVAEVDELGGEHPAAALLAVRDVDHHVRGLDVHVHDAERVQLAHALEEVDDVAHDGVRAPPGVPQLAHQTRLLNRHPPVLGPQKLHHEPDDAERRTGVRWVGARSRTAGRLGERLGLGGDEADEAAGPGEAASLEEVEHLLEGPQPLYGLPPPPRVRLQPLEDLEQRRPPLHLHLHDPPVPALFHGLRLPRCRTRRVRELEGPEARAVGHRRHLGRQPLHRVFSFPHAVLLGAAVGVLSGQRA